MQGTHPQECRAPTHRNAGHPPAGMQGTHPQECRGHAVDEHGVLAGQGLHGITELDDLVAVHATHPSVDVPARSRVGQARPVSACAPPMSCPRSFGEIPVRD